MSASKSNTPAKVFSPGPSKRQVKDPQGKLHEVPKDWELLPPGDAGLTRRVKAAGPSWAVIEMRGRKKFSQGLWAPAANIALAREALESERADPAYARRRAADAVRREKKQVEYVGSFEDAVLEYLNFAPRHRALALKIARAVTTHATPVGSGTVARTQRIPIEKRAESAVIAWMRHQTTDYDEMKIARVKGERRRVRQQLAGESKRLLEQFRRGTGDEATLAHLF